MVSKLKIENLKLKMAAIRLDFAQRHVFVKRQTDGLISSLENGLVLLKNKTAKPKPFLSAGFTLLEFLVVISISIIIITALVIQHNKWNDQLMVSTQAYELALMVRQAQVYGLGVRQDPGGSGDRFNVGYGVYMHKNNPDRYTFFADRNNDKIYQSSEAIETKVLSRGVVVKDVCGEWGGSSRCFVGGGPLQQVNIVFFRPDTKPVVSLLNNGGGGVANPPVTITLMSPGNKEVRLIIEDSGRVSVMP